jgi:hypothetical protein
MMSMHAHGLRARSPVCVDLRVQHEDTCRKRRERCTTASRHSISSGRSARCSLMRARAEAKGAPSGVCFGGVSCRTVSRRLWCASLHSHARYVVCTCSQSSKSMQARTYIRIFPASICTECTPFTRLISRTVMISSLQHIVAERARSRRRTEVALPHIHTQVRYTCWQTLRSSCATEISKFH